MFWLSYYCSWYLCLSTRPAVYIRKSFLHFLIPVSTVKHDADRAVCIVSFNSYAYIHFELLNCVSMEIYEMDCVDLILVLWISEYEIIDWIPCGNKIKICMMIWKVKVYALVNTHRISLYRSDSVLYECQILLSPCHSIITINTCFNLAVALQLECFG